MSNRNCKNVVYYDHSGNPVMLSDILAQNQLSEIACCVGVTVTNNNTTAVDFVYIDCDNVRTTVTIQPGETTSCINGLAWNITNIVNLVIVNCSTVIPTPPATALSLTDFTLGITDTHGTDGTAPCTSWDSQVLSIGSDGVTFPLTDTITASTLDLCGIEVTELGLPDGNHTLYFKRDVEDCGGTDTDVLELTANIQCTPYGTPCMVSNQNLKLEYSSNVVLAKPSATEVDFRLTSTSPATHTTNLQVLQWLAGNPADRWVLEDLTGMPLWWTGTSIMVLSSTSTTIDVRLNTASTGWNGAVDINTCKDEIGASNLDDTLNKTTIQSAYDTLNIGDDTGGNIVPFALYEVSRTAPVNCQIIGINGIDCPVPLTATITGSTKDGYAQSSSNAVTDGSYEFIYQIDGVDVGTYAPITGVIPDCTTAAANGQFITIIVREIANPSNVSSDTRRIANQVIAEYTSDPNLYRKTITNTAPDTAHALFVGTKFWEQLQIVNNGTILPFVIEVDLITNTYVSTPALPTGISITNYTPTSFDVEVDFAALPNVTQVEETGVLATNVYSDGVELRAVTPASEAYDNCTCVINRVALNVIPDRPNFTYNSSTLQFRYNIPGLIQTAGTITSITADVVNITTGQLISVAQSIPVATGFHAINVTNIAPANGDIVEITVTVNSTIGSFIANIKRGAVTVSGTAVAVGTLVRVGARTGSLDCSGFTITGLPTVTTASNPCTTTQYCSLTAQTDIDTLESPLSGTSYIVAPSTGFIDFSSVNVGDIFYDVDTYLEDNTATEGFTRNGIFVKTCI